MVLFIILGLVVLIAFVVLGVLFFMLGKEGQKATEEKIVVPLTDLDKLRKELSAGKDRPGPGLLEPEKPKLAADDAGIIASYQPKVSLPTQEAHAPIDDAYKQRAKDLEDELQAISKKAAMQSDEAKQMIENLTQENESLKSQKADLQEAQQKLTVLQDEASGLKTENVSLQTRLESTNVQVRQLEEEMGAFKIQMGQEIARANATVTELAREKEALLAAPQPSPDDGLRQEVESLKAEQLQLKQKYEDLDRTYQKLRELNAHLIEKNDLLQYEMIKARAQSSGLERVSFNYRNQVEDFSKKVHAAQATNEHLSQAKNRLEGMMEQIKSENEELVKKDQLTQFELEKNRSRLNSLQREYEELKARLST